jgi:hypothetical protein
MPEAMSYPFSQFFVLFSFLLLVLATNGAFGGVFGLCLSQQGKLLYGTKICQHDQLFLLSHFSIAFSGFRLSKIILFLAGNGFYLMAWVVVPLWWSLFTLPQCIYCLQATIIRMVLLRSMFCVIFLTSPSALFGGWWLLQQSYFVGLIALLGPFSLYLECLLAYNLLPKFNDILDDWVDSAFNCLPHFSLGIIFPQLTSEVA